MLSAAGPAGGRSELHMSVADMFNLVVCFTPAMFSYSDAFDEEVECYKEVDLRISRVALGRQKGITEP